MLQKRGSRVLWQERRHDGFCLGCREEFPPNAIRRGASTRNRNGGAGGVEISSWTEERAEAKRSDGKGRPDASWGRCWPEDSEGRRERWKTGSRPPWRPLLSIESRSVGTSLCLVPPGFNPSSPHIPVMFSKKVSQSLSLHSVYHAREILPLLTAVKIR